MSEILAVRHMPLTLTFHEKEEILKHFGALKVWEIPKRKYIIFASYPNSDEAKIALFRMHQYEIGNRRLVVEYARKEDQNHLPPPTRNNFFCNATKNTKVFIELLSSIGNKWFQPFPPYLKYEYPEPNHKTFMNIVYWLMQNNEFLRQVLHIMNYMSLPCPFNEDEVAQNHFMTQFEPYFLYKHNEVLKEDEIQESSELESEMSSEDDKIKEKLVTPKLIKRKHLLPKTRKRVQAMCTTTTMPKTIKKVDPASVFEEPNLKENKKIFLNLPQDLVTKNSDNIVGNITKMIPMRPETSSATEPKFETRQLDTISKHDLFQNKLSEADMKDHTLFKNYLAGEPSMKLYLKNLSKSVTNDDIKRIYRRYIIELPFTEQEAFDVKVMQEGRMKGQGFVTLPSIEVAKKALHETNGYILFDKPLVVQFARVANKKPA